jgi:hypothetical protein
MEQIKSNQVIDSVRRLAGGRPHVTARQAPVDWRRAKRWLVRVGGAATAVLAFAAATLTACGQDDGSGGAGQQGGLSVSVVEPAAGAAVSVPFTVRVAASVPLGPTESGRHHVHIWFDDNDADYLVVESETVQITDVAAGSHTMHVSLRNANHSAAGAETQTTVMVGGAAPTAVTSAPPADSTGDPYGY